MNTKRLFLSLFFLISLFSVSYSQVQKQKLLTLNTAEYLMMDESQILSATSASQICILTKEIINGDITYNRYINGKKVATYTEENIELCEISDVENYVDCVYYDENADYADENLVQYADDGMIIYCNGKEFGPYSTVEKIILSKDKTKFYAVVIQDGSSLFVSNTGKPIELKGVVTDLLVGPDYSNAYVICAGQMDFTKMENFNPEDLDLEALSQYYIYNNYGETFGPYNSASFEKWFSPFSTELLWYADDEVFVNGKSIGIFPNGVNIYSFWYINSKQFALISGDEIIFSSGDKYAYPMQILSQKFNDKLNLKWISLEGQDLYLYSKFF